ncbi:nucleotide-binding alpha-beta plait domain-containing protein [Tanacetum coccineum]
MGSQRSKEDEVQKISTSIFVTNFPDQFTAKELWNTCKQYGYVVDAFIPNRRSKAGKRFGFVRFINVFDAEHLRASMNNNSNQFKNNEVKRNHTHDAVKRPVNSYLHAVKRTQTTNLGMESNPVLVLDESCLNQQDYTFCLLGKVKEFASLTNLKVVLVNEGFDNVKLRYMGGFWVMLEFSSDEVKKKFQSCVAIGTWFSQLQQASNDFTTDGRVTWVELEGIPLKMWSENTFKRIASKWGVLLHVDDQEESCKAYLVRAKEVPDWVPDFVEEENEVDEPDDGTLEEEPNDNVDDGIGDNKIDEVPDTIFEEVLHKSNVPSADSLKYPPRFTPRDDTDDGEVQSVKRNVSIEERDDGIHNIHEEAEITGSKKSDSRMSPKENGTESLCSGHFKKPKTPYSGGSILLLMDELVKVGQTMGYNMEGCMKNIEEIIESQGVNDVHQ